MQNIDNLDLKDKIILIRTDYNIPIQDQKIINDYRIKSSIPTIELLLSKKVKKIIIISHLGRPDGKIDNNLSLLPVYQYLKQYFSNNIVNFINDIFNQELVNQKISKQGITLLENLRFYPGEESNDPDFADYIIKITKPDLFIQDGFAVIHRAHASTDLISQKIPTYAGLLLRKEINNLSKIKQNPNRPLLVIIGGSKVSDKKPLIDKFINQADYIYVGGKISADGYSFNNPKIITAHDYQTDQFGNKLDIGPSSTQVLLNLIHNSKSVIWNGLLGKAEDPLFSFASSEVAKYIGKTRKLDSVICGGDTVGFVENIKQKNPKLNYTLLSTGGGASLEFLLDHELPGLKYIK